MEKVVIGGKVVHEPPNGMERFGILCLISCNLLQRSCLCQTDPDLMLYS